MCVSVQRFRFYRYISFIIYIYITLNLYVLIKRKSAKKEEDRALQNTQKNDTYSYIAYELPARETWSSPTLASYVAIRGDRTGVRTDART